MEISTGQTNWLFQQQQKSCKKRKRREIGWLKNLRDRSRGKFALGASGPDSDRPKQKYLFMIQLEKFEC